MLFLQSCSRRIDAPGVSVGNYSQRVILEQAIAAFIRFITDLQMCHQNCHHAGSTSHHAGRG